jgi:PAS domain S-box-containing protein
VPSKTRAKAAARGSCAEADFQLLSETLSSLTVLIRGDKIVYVNPATSELLGRPREWFLGRDFFETVHPDDREAAIARRRARLAGIPQPRRLQERLVHADGRTIWMDYSVDMLQFEGQPATLVTGHDVSEQRRIEEEYRRSEARLAEAQRIGNIGSWEWDVPNNQITWSDEMCRIFGVEPSQFGAELDGYVELLHPDDRAMTREVLTDALARGGPFAFEHRLVGRDGVTRTIFGRGEVFCGADGKPVRVAGTGQDITERRRMERDLRTSEERFRNICQQAPVMLMSVGQDVRIRDISNFWLQTMGYARSEVIGADAWKFITVESRRRLEQAIEEGERNGEVVIRNFPLQAIRRDGGLVDLLSTSVAEMGDDGESKGAICVSINLTDLQRAEAALRESEERYRALVEYAPEAIMVLDVDQDRFVDANAPAVSLFGYSRERLLTMGSLDFCPLHQADRRPSCEVLEQQHRRVMAGETAAFEFTHVDAKGRDIVCQMRMSPLPAAGRRLIRTTITDITELKHLQDKVRHAEKLTAVGMMAAGIAHEIGNPLMALSMAAQNLERRSGDGYTQNKLGLIREHIDRINRIVRQMSDLAKPASGRRGPCDLNQTVRRAVEMVRHDQRARNTTMDYRLTEHLPIVQASEDELIQVCLNLALNAFDAMAANAPDRPRRLLIHTDVEQDAVRVTFRDTGPGVPPEVRDKLFQPFFTTKDVGQGSGLGLSVSYRILQEHRGTLVLDESVTEGAAFVLVLPLGAGR